MTKENEQNSDPQKTAVQTRQRPSLKFSRANLQFPIALVALIISLGALIQSWHAHGETKELPQALATLTSAQQQNEELIKGLSASFSARNQQITAELNSLTSKLTKSLSQKGIQQETWLPINAKHFLELAEISNHWNNNPQSTIALLQAATAALENTSGTELFTVRQAIAETIAQLKAMKKLDWAGLLSELDAAQSLVQQMPVKTGQNVLLSSSTPNSPPEQDQWHKSLHLLGKLVIVQHHETDITPLLLPMYQSLLRETINMNLQMAKWAALQQDRGLYQQSLQQALTEIGRSFDPSSPLTQNIIQQLQALAQRPLQNPDIDVSRPLQLLNQYLDKSQDTPSPSLQEGGA